MIERNVISQKTMTQDKQTLLKEYYERELKQGNLRECLMTPEFGLTIKMWTPGRGVGKQLADWIVAEKGVVVTKDGKREYTLHFKTAEERDKFLTECFDEEGHSENFGPQELTGECHGLFLMAYIYGFEIEVDTD